MRDLGKIIILSIPYTGHINPAAGIAQELVNKKFKVIFFGNSEHEEIIKATGAEFRAYSKFLTYQFFDKVKIDNNIDIDFILDGICWLDAVSSNLISLINMINQEKPDLIVHDVLSVHAKYLLEYFERKNSPIKSATISTSFEMQENVYPNYIEKGLDTKFKHNLKSFYYLLLVDLKQISFSLKYDFSVKNPLNYITEFKSELNLVTVFPELHPRSHLFEKRHKFVGNCIKESLRSYQSTDDSKVSSLLNSYETLNSRNLEINDYFLDESFSYKDKNQLIFVSLGTVFNDRIDVFTKIIEGLKLIKSADILIACGKKVLNQLEVMKKDENIIIPENIILVKSAPQLSVLKRASLFITHSGMNSISESIHFGVPVICIPLFWDQPRVAYRVTVELGLGICLDSNNFKSEQIFESVKKIFNDKSYLERTLRYSKISHKYNGCINSADLVEQLINK